LNYRFIVLGALLVAIGALVFAYPGVFSSQVPASGHLLLVRVSPNNYSYVQQTLSPQQTLQVTMSSSPDSVDFFLMNNGNFSAWTSRGSAPTNVYPQTRLDVKNYTFPLIGSGSPQSYSLVFVSRSSSTSTNVLLQLETAQGVDTLQSLVVPIIFLASGVASALFGATRRQKVVEAPPQSDESQGGGFLGLFGGTDPGVKSVVAKCRYCGADVGAGSAFCPSCKRAQQ
jgi:hypothetical protein